MGIKNSFLLVLLLATAAGAATPPYDDGLIIPGSRIGPVHLGMTRQEINAAKGGTDCAITAVYDASGHAVWLETNSGGACQVSDPIQVGFDTAPLVQTLGAPEKIVKDATYADTIAFWWVYSGRGIAFRVLLIRGSATQIQAIAVFSGMPLGAGRSLPILPVY